MYKFEDVHGDKEDYEKYLAVQKKVKKEKTIRDKLFSDLKRKKKKKPKSSFQEIIDGLSKKKYKDFYEIKDYLSSEKGINVKKRTLTFLETVMKARVVNGKFTVSDTFANTPITYKIVGSEFNTSYMTNDNLWIASKFREIFDGDSYFCLPFDNKFYIKSAQIVSSPFLFNGVSEKGFLQDNDPDFFSYNIWTDKYNVLSEKSDELLKFNKDVQIFKYQGKTYSKVGNASKCIIVESSRVKDAKDLSQKQYKFSVDKIKKSGIGAKTIEVKNKPRYIDTKLKPDNFCPAYFSLGGYIVSAKMLFNIAFDYNSFYEMIITYAKNNNSVIKFPNDFFYWDNLPLMMDLFTSLSVTGKSFGLPENMVYFITKICEKYFPIKTVLDLWGRLMLDIQKLCRDFFNCFNNKINFDTLVDMKKRVTDLIEDHKTLRDDESLIDVVAFFTETLKDWDLCIRNQMNHDNIKNLLKLIKSALKEIEDGKLQNLDKIEKAAAIIYNVSYSYKDDNTVLFPIVLSPGAFFGNKLDKEEDRTKMYEEIVKNFIEKEENKQIDNEKKDKEILNLVQNKDYYMSVIVDTNCQQYINSKLKEIEGNNVDQAKGYNAMRLYADKDIKNNKKLENFLMEKIVQSKGDLNSLKLIGIDNTHLEKWYQNTIGMMINKKRTNELNNQINILENQKNLLNQAYDSPDYPSDDETLREIYKSVITGKPLTYRNKPLALEKTIYVPEYYRRMMKLTGIYDDFIKGSAYKRALESENINNLIATFPIAPSIISKIRTIRAYPTLGQVIRGKGIPSHVEPSEEETKYFKRLNAYLMTGDDFYGRPNMEVELDSNYDNLVKGMYQDTAEKAQKLESYSQYGKELEDNDVVMNLNPPEINSNFTTKSTMPVEQKKKTLFKTTRIDTTGPKQSQYQKNLDQDDGKYF